jgi:NMD protein affecting ribosome stability and mRNA decay
MNPQPKAVTIKPALNVPSQQLSGEIGVICTHCAINPATTTLRTPSGSRDAVCSTCHAYAALSAWCEQDAVLRDPKAQEASA